jgi:hypothetical protein
MQICFDNREADIGRFLRRQLTGQDATALAHALAQFSSIVNVPPPPTLEQLTYRVLDDGEQRFQRAIAGRTLSDEEKPLLEAGTWEVALIIEPPKADTVPDHVYLNTIRSSNPALTGWPVWMDTRTVVDQTAWPVVRDGAWEALIVSVRGWSKHLDFMCLHPKGEFYLLRNLPDDVSDRVPPRALLDPNLIMWRVTEAMAVGLAFARGLGWKPPDTHLGFGFRWRRLKGRRLEPWTDPMSVIGGGTSEEDEHRSFVESNLDTPPSALAPLVNQATRGLFALFSGATIPMPVIENVVSKVLKRTF